MGERGQSQLPCLQEGYRLQCRQACKQYANVCDDTLNSEQRATSQRAELPKPGRIQQTWNVNNSHV